MFRKVLIANRGEIACRVIRTARKLGIAAVAVFSDADRDALHVRRADEARAIGPSPPKESYLDAEKILDAARRSGAEAVHPGYGFLSESAEFAAGCQRAGLVFIGPSPEAMKAVGAKAEAKKLAARIGVPTLAGYLGEKQDSQSFVDAAEVIGFPLVVKASAGGGGRGMRIVRSSGELVAAMESARREALLAFGDDRLLLEKYLDRPRHLEVQIIADNFGNVLTFPIRDCSLQRNHQKLVEESPAPGVSETLRRRLGDAAAEIARASNYVNAGTIEFLTQDDAFYFLEANARLQVEHPVTEMVTGVDLVEWQFRVAAGEPLPARPDGVGAKGCAIEARICAEDPAENFHPSSGAITHLSFPKESEYLRLETGVQDGDAVSPFYDSLLAKLIVWGETRAEAVRKLRRSLEAVELVGVTCNVDFLGDVASQDKFVAGGVDTTFLSLFHWEPRQEITDEWLLAAALANWRDRVSRAPGGWDKWSPWTTTDSWRLYGSSSRTVSFRFGDRILSCGLGWTEGPSFWMETPEGRWDVFATIESGRVALWINQTRRELTVVSQGSSCVVIHKGRNYRLEWIDPLKPPSPEIDRSKSFLAPLPARVTKVFVRDGDHVTKGAPILVLEAMKMEIPMNSPDDGVVEAVFCAEGESVKEGDQLVAMAALP